MYSSTIISNLDQILHVVICPPGNQYDDYDDDTLTDDPEIERYTKIKKKDLEDLKPLLNGSVSDGHRYMERFNRDMMDQFMEYQKRAVSDDLI